MKQETVSGSGITWAICKSAPCSRQITTPASHHSVFYRPDALPTAQPTASKHWRQLLHYRVHNIKFSNRTNRHTKSFFFFARPSSSKSWLWSCSLSIWEGNLTTHWINCSANAVTIWICSSAFNLHTDKPQTDILIHMITITTTSVVYYVN